MQTCLGWRIFLVVAAMFVAAAAIDLNSRIRERDAASLAATLSHATAEKK